jgi:UDP-2,3-diacylglucosamine pyrophosphatase LpxH
MPHPMVLKIEVPNQKLLKLALFSDLHIDNPKCRRDLLKQDLDMALKEDRWIIFNGDTFCLMQGKYDPRRNKSDVRTEHNSSAYIDDVIEETADFLKPYAKRILMFGTGNHESSILNRIETDVLMRLVEKIKLKTKQYIYVGAYHGWVMIRFIEGDGSKRSDSRIPFKIYYNHGTGGDPIVSKGTIEHERWNTSVEGADMIWGGNNHNQYHIPTMVHFLDSSGNVNCVPKARTVHNLRTSTYKQEYTDHGWHIETGKRAKPIGFYKLDLVSKYLIVNGKQKKYVEPEIVGITHNELDLLTPEQLQYRKFTSEEVTKR